MGIWTATKCLAAEDSVRNNGWGIVASSALTLLIEVAVASLLAFHFYISCFENVTTFEHNYEPRKSSDVVEKININLWEAPVSGHRIRRQEGKALYWLIQRFYLFFTRFTLIYTSLIFFLFISIYANKLSINNSFSFIRILWNHNLATSFSTFLCWIFYSLLAYNSFSFSPPFKTFWIKLIG